MFGFATQIATLHLQGCNERTIQVLTDIQASYQPNQIFDALAFAWDRAGGKAKAAVLYFAYKRAPHIFQSTGVKPDIQFLDMPLECRNKLREIVPQIAVELMELGAIAVAADGMHQGAKDAHSHNAEEFKALAEMQAKAVAA